MGSRLNESGMSKDLEKDKSELTLEQRRQKLEHLRKHGNLKDVTLNAIVDTRIGNMTNEEVVQHVFKRTDELKTVNKVFSDAKVSIEPRYLSEYLKEAKHIQAKQQDLKLEEAAKILVEVKCIQKENLDLNLVPISGMGAPGPEELAKARVKSHT